MWKYSYKCVLYLFCACFAYVMYHSCKQFMYPKILLRRGRAGTTTHRSYRRVTQSVTSPAQAMDKAAAACAASKVFASGCSIELGQNPSVILECSKWWSTVLISKKQHVSSWASLSSFHPTLCQGSIKDVISAAQSGGDSKSPMQSPVIATTSGKPIHQMGGKTKKHNDNYFFFIHSPTTNMAREKWWLPDDSFLFGLLGPIFRAQLAVREGTFWWIDAVHLESQGFWGPCFSWFFVCNKNTTKPIMNISWTTFSFFS